MHEHENLFIRKFNLIIKNVFLLFKVQKKYRKFFPNVVKTKNGKIMVSSNCAVCGRKKSKFLKEQEAKGLLNIIGKIALIAPLL